MGYNKSKVLRFGKGILEALFWVPLVDFCVFKKGFENEEEKNKRALVFEIGPFQCCFVLFLIS